MEDDLWSQIASWCSRNDARLERQHPNIQGERFEVSWQNDDDLVRFIDVYPRAGDRVLVQGGAYLAGGGASVPEDERMKGPLQVRHRRDVGEILTRLKNHADATDRSELIGLVESQLVSTRT